MTAPEEFAKAYADNYDRRISSHVEKAFLAGFAEGERAGLERAASKLEKHADDMESLLNTIPQPEGGLRAESMIIGLRNHAKSIRAAGESGERTTLSGNLARVRFVGELEPMPYATEESL